LRGNTTQKSDDNTGSEGESIQISVGSKNFTEQVLLGTLAIEILRENTAATVLDNTDFGNTETCREGIVNGDIHVFWEYIGTAWFWWQPQMEESLGTAQDAYTRVTEHVESNYELTTLDMTPFENSFELFALPETIEETGIETISDLAAYVNDGGYDIRIALEDEFYQRGDGWPGLVDHYGFERQALERWDDNGGIVIIDPGLGYDMVDQVDAEIGLGYTTNAQVSAYNLQRIEDDRNFWPPYNVFPTVTETKATSPVVTELNNLPSAFENAREMQQLNERVDIDGEDPDTVARDFLGQKNLI
jgi:osmoprotectant transport system substrate-binding protein